MPFNFIYTLMAGVCLWCVTSCHRDAGNSAQKQHALKNDTVLKYAKRFAIRKDSAFTLVYVFGNRARPGDTTATYLVTADSSLAKRFNKAVFIKTPCTKVAALSSIYANMLCDLGALEQLAAIDNMDYVINPQITAKYKAGRLMELSRGPAPDLEQTIALKPDIVFTFGMGEPGRDVNPKLSQSGIPVAVSLDHLEETPLARAEWIKFYAAFVGRPALADSLFNATEKNYRRLCGLAKRADKHPAVFSELKYGDAWYVPGGKSYVAQLLHDAGAAYVWEDVDKTGSLPLSFEQVYAKAKDAAFWINLSMVQSKAELLKQEPRYAEFNAFKTGQLYNNNKVVNALGYSTYWETGMTYPDRILSDLIVIFHPELKVEVGHALYYYKQLP